MADKIMDQLNETPVTYGILLAYVTMAYLTGTFHLNNEGHWGQLITYGGAAGILVQDGEGWRLLSHAFLHGGILHLLLNLFGLFFFGPILESYLRTWRFIVLYLVGALSGCLFALLVTEESVPLVGGSGALFAMAGATLALSIRGGRTLLDFLGNTSARWLLSILALNLLVGFLIPIISNAAHIGGLVGGFILVFCFYDTGRRRVVNKTGRWIQAGWCALLLTLTLYALNPVLRFDYNLAQYLNEEDASRRQTIRTYLFACDGFEEFRGPLHEELQEFLKSENEPRTGIPGVIFRQRRGEHSLYPRTIKRWKRRR